MIFLQRPRLPPAASLILALALAACEVGPDYRAPATALAPFHNATDVSDRIAGGAPPLDTWWTGFRDPELDRLIELGLAQNLDLAAALARVQQARAAARAAGAGRLPPLAAAGAGAARPPAAHRSVSEIASNLPGYNRSPRVYDVGAAASWEIDLSGGLSRGEEAAAAEAQLADARLAGTRITVAAEIADAYFQLRGDQARLAVVQQQIDVDAHLLDLIWLQRGQGWRTSVRSPRPKPCCSRRRRRYPC